MNQTRTIDSKALKNGDTLMMLELSSDWYPWAYQITRIVPDGRAYGRPKEPCRTSMSNFRTREQAEAVFAEAV